MVSDEEVISQYTHNLKFLKSMKQFLGLMTLIFHLQVLSVMKAIQSQSRWRIFSVMWRFYRNRSLKQSGIINDGGNDLVRLIDENRYWPIMLPVACSLPCLKVGETVCWLWLHTALIYFHFECSYSRGVCDGHEAKVWQIAEYSK